MRQASIRVLTLAATFFVAAFVAIQSAPPASAQTGEGWITLLDEKNMGDWDQVGETNWRMEDGAVVADKRTSKETAHLVSKQSYKDFMLHVEFWASEDANSGIYLRCQDPKTITDRNCYEANIFDQRKARPPGRRSRSPARH
jgi:hypothetical protein